MGGCRVRRNSDPEGRQAGLHIHDLIIVKLTQPYEGGPVISLILQMRTLRLEEVTFTCPRSHNSEGAEQGLETAAGSSVFPLPPR